MKAVSEATSLQLPSSQTARPTAHDRRDDFAAHLRRTNHTQDAAKSADATSTDEPAQETTKADDTETTDDTTSTAQTEDPAQPDSTLQWLAAQLLAFKVKEPTQTVKDDGSTETAVKTSVVTLPASAVAAGLAPPAPGLGAPSDPNVLPAVTTTDAPVTVLPAVDETVSLQPAEPSVQPAPPPVATRAPAVAAEPTQTAPREPLPAAAALPPVDPSLVAAQSETAQAATVPFEAPGSAKPPIADDGSADPQSIDVTPGENSSRAPAGVTHAHASTSGDMGSGLSGGSDDASTGDGSASDSPVPALQAGMSPGQGTTAGVTQTHLAVPADHQLAPTLGLELASTAQGMSALDRVLQATDQSQAPGPMLKVLNLQLAPPDLGAVSVRLSLEGSAIDVHMSVDQGRTRTLIERDRHVIADSLTKVGYSVTTLTVEQSSATGDSNMSSAGQTFSSNHGFDGSSGRQSNGAGGFGGSQGQSARATGFMDNDAGAAAPARPANGPGLFV